MKQILFADNILCVSYLLWLSDSYIVSNMMLEQENLVSGVDGDDLTTTASDHHNTINALC